MTLLHLPLRRRLFGMLLQFAAALLALVTVAQAEVRLPSGRVSLIRRLALS